jgi:anaerobic ribonucleoside-triphosphate reductase activating protein
MKYAGINKNDVVNGQGVCVSVWVQGCPHHCEGCFNPETWDFNGGYDVPNDIKGQVVKALSANGVQRNLSILGGEPLCPENSKLVLEILNAVRSAYPNIKIFLWTGEILSNLLSNKDSVVNSILDKIDVLIDGPFEKENRDFTLALRGSSNQRIYEKNPNGEWVNQSDIYDWKN